MSTNTPESPITVTVDHDPRGVSVGVWQGSHCIYSGAHPLPAAPDASTVEDAQPVAWMDPQTLDVISAERKAAWLRDYGAGGAAKAASYTRALGDIGAPAPAAGDAQEKFLIHGPVGRISHETLDKLLDPEWQMLRNEPASLWTTNSPPSRAVLEVYVRGPEGMIDAAIAAQRKGDA